MASKDKLKIQVPKLNNKDDTNLSNVSLTKTISIGSNQSVTSSPKKRKKLRAEQGLIPLIGIGVGAVISGDFFGWNYGLERGGFGGLIVSTIIVAIMYLCVALSLAEMSAIYPSAEGAFAFSRAAFGSYGGFLCGLSETIEYVLLVPVIFTGIGDHLNLLFQTNDENYKYLWWSLLALFYLILHLWGSKPTFLSNTIFTFLSLITLFLFWCVCISIISNDSPKEINQRIYNIPIDENFKDSNIFFPKGFYGIFTSLTFAAWFFIAVEELPLTGEDAINPKKNIPKALIWSIIILMITGFLTLIFSVSVPGGSFNISSTASPLVRAITAGLMNKCVNHNEDGEAVCNNSDLNCEWNIDEETCYDKKLSNIALAWDTCINLGTLIGLLTSCHAVIFAGGRQLMSLTRNGSFHPITNFDKITNSTPRIALAVDIILAYLITIITHSGFGKGVDFLLSLSVASACCSYLLSMFAFIKLRFINKNQYKNQYKSPFGIIGASYAAFISFTIFISFFVDIAVSLGVNTLIAVLTSFLSIYFLASLEFLCDCHWSSFSFCHRKSGKMRYNQYENRFIQIYHDNNNNILDENDELIINQANIEMDVANSENKNNEEIIEEEHIYTTT